MILIFWENYKTGPIFLRLVRVTVTQLGHRGRSGYVFTHSCQNPVLVYIAELLLGFLINTNQFVATSA